MTAATEDRMRENGDDWTTITGNTYPVKDSLKRLGCRWDGASRCWQAPAARAEEAQRLVDSATTVPGTATPRRSLSRGELWQECMRRGCREEPVCVACEYCARHCGCPDDPSEAVADVAPLEPYGHGRHGVIDP